MKRYFLFAAALLACALPCAYGQTGNPADLQQKLNAAFKITTMAANHLEIAVPGDVVELHKDGLKMSALNTVLTESNTYRDGKIGGGDAKRGWGSFGTAMLQVTAASGGAFIPNGIPPRTMATGERCWILSIIVQKDGVQFKLLTDPDGNGMRFHGDLKFPFANKKVVPSADEILPTIAEVLTVVPPDDQGAQPSPDGPYAAYAGEYVFEMTGTHYIFHPDGSCTVRNPGGTQVQCSFIVEGDWIRLMMKMGNSNIPAGSFKKQGDKLYMNGTIAPNAELVRQGVPPEPAPEAAPQPPPAPMPAIAPPPPPADAPPPTISLGETMSQVTAGFGQPQKEVKLGVKVIFYYKDMKVVFTNGKVSNVD
jgi:hypothetical protein